WPSPCRSPVPDGRGWAVGPAGSAGGVQPADRGAVARAAERLKLVVPGAAEQPVQFPLQDRRAVGAKGERGAQLVLRDEDVAVGAGGRGEQPEVGCVAVAQRVTA